MQEERRERRDNYVPETSALDPLLVKKVDSATKAMLNEMGLPLSGIEVVQEGN